MLGELVIGELVMGELVIGILVMGELVIGILVIGGEICCTTFARVFTNIPIT